ERAASFARETGARHAATPADAARNADVVITCLSTSKDVAALLGGTDGLMAGLKRGAVVVDCTSGDPATSRRIAAQLAEHGVDFIDAPVGGGTIGAEKGTLTVMVGGDAAALERVRPVLQTFGQKVVHCGDVGAGDAVKAVNNASSGRSNTSMNLFPERVLTRTFPKTFRLALLEKDIGIAAELARQQRVPAPILQLTADLFRVARGELGETADHVEAVKMIEGWAGVEIA